VKNIFLILVIAMGAFAQTGYVVKFRNLLLGDSAVLYTDNKTHLDSINFKSVYKNISVIITDTLSFDGNYQCSTKIFLSLDGRGYLRGDNNDKSDTLFIAHLKDAPARQWIDTNLVVIFMPGATDKIPPEWWGGAPDGTTNNWRAINHAISGGRNIRNLYFGAGGYRIDSTIVFTNDSGWSISGTGYESCIFSPSGSNSLGVGIFVMFDCKDMEVKNLRLVTTGYGNFAPAAGEIKSQGPVIAFAGCSSCVAIGNWIESDTFRTAQNSYGVYLSGSKRCIVSNNTIARTAECVGEDDWYWNVSGKFCRGNIIADNQCYDNSYGGVVIDNIRDSGGIIVSGNSIYNSWGSGIFLGNMSNFTVTNNYIKMDYPLYVSDVISHDSVAPYYCIKEHIAADSSRPTSGAAWEEFWAKRCDTLSWWDTAWVRCQKYFTSQGKARPCLVYDREDGCVKINTGGWVNNGIIANNVLVEGMNSFTVNGYARLQNVSFVNNQCVRPAEHAVRYYQSNILTGMENVNITGNAIIDPGRNGLHFHSWGTGNLHILINQNKFSRTYIDSVNTGVYSEGVPYLRIDKNLIRGRWNQGIYLSGWGCEATGNYIDSIIGTGIFYQPSHWYKINENTITYCGSGIVDTGAYVMNTEICGNNIRNMATSGIELSGFLRNVKINRNQIYESQGIVWSNTSNTIKNISVTGNIIRNIDSRGIDFRTNNTYFPIDSNYGNLFADNIIRQDSAEGLGNYSGLILYGLSNSIIRNNLVSGLWSYSYDLWGADLLIEGNHGIGANQGGMIVWQLGGSKVFSNYIKNCNISDSGYPAYYFRGVDTGAYRSNNIVISNNTADGGYYGYRFNITKCTTLVLTNNISINAKSAATNWAGVYAKYDIQNNSFDAVNTWRVGLKTMNATASSSKTTGSGIFAGGVGISGSTYCANVFPDSVYSAGGGKIARVYSDSTYSTAGGLSRLRVGGKQPVYGFSKTVDSMWIFFGVNDSFKITR
jgi:parallel beta-helix repeat protein